MNLSAIIALYFAFFVLPYVVYASLLFARAPRSVLGYAIIFLGIVTLAEMMVMLFGLLGPVKFPMTTLPVYAVMLFQYLIFVRSEAYGHYQALPIHKHLLAVLVILFSTGLEVFFLMYFFSRDLWLWGILSMLLVASLSVGWLIWWYRSGPPPGEQAKPAEPGSS